MKLSFLALVLSLLATPAFACFDRDAKLLPDGYAAIRAYGDNNRSFTACTDKLEAEGVNLKDVSVWRKERAAGDTGPVVYSILIQGKDSAERQVRLKLEYNIRKHAFTCGEPSRNIPRGGCF